MKVKVTRFDKIMLIMIAYSGLGHSIYSLIRKSLYTKELLDSFISIILWTLFVVAAHIAVHKHQQNKNNDK